MSETERKCPGCGSDDYLFRGRKKIAEGETEQLETRFLCKSCNKVWKDRMPVQKEAS